MFEILQNLIKKEGDFMENEIWKPLVYRFVKRNMYEVSNYGNIRNVHTGRMLTPCPSEKGYMMACLRCVDNKSRNIKIHKIVAELFVPGRTITLNEVNHKDGDKENNSMWNLEWTSRSANIRHGFENGLIPVMRGSRNGMTIYDEKTVRLVCERLIMFGGSINRTFKYLKSSGINIDRNLVMDIKYKKRWRHISDEYFKRENFKH